MAPRIQPGDGKQWGTSLQGYVTATIEELNAAFPGCFIGSGDKTTHEWVVLIDDEVVTVYDYKWEAVPGVAEEFHVGGGRGAIEALRKVFPNARPWR